jgi:hypothetical protein
MIYFLLLWAIPGIIYAFKYDVMDSEVKTVGDIFARIMIGIMLGWILVGVYSKTLHRIWNTKIK